jgi:hypothetical protein
MYLLQNGQHITEEKNIRLKIREVDRIDSWMNIGDLVCHYE